MTAKIQIHLGITKHFRQLTYNKKPNEFLYLNQNP